MKYKLIIFLNCCLLLTACKFIQPIEDEDPYLQELGSTPQSQQEAPSPGQGSQYRPPSPQGLEVNPTPPPVTPSSTKTSPSSGTGTILVQKTCCYCRSGGKLIAIPKAQEASHNSNLARCGNPLCPMSYNCLQWKTQCQTSPCSVNVLNQLSSI